MLWITSRCPGGVTGKRVTRQPVKRARELPIEWWKEGVLAVAYSVVGENCEVRISVDAAATTKGGEGIDGGFVERRLHRVKDCAKCGQAQRKRASGVHYA